MNLDASSKVTLSKNISSFLGTINRNPLVGLGVVDKKTFINLTFTFFYIIPFFY